MEQENWINEILDSTSGMTSATPDVKLYSKIQKKIESQKTVEPQWIFLVAASIIILVALNITFLISNNSEMTKDEATEQLAFTISKSNQLY